jgi:hypothetical protein
MFLMNWINDYSSKTSLPEPWSLQESEKIEAEMGTVLGRAYIFHMISVAVGTPSDNIFKVAQKSTVL